MKGIFFQDRSNEFFTHLFSTQFLFVAIRIYTISSDIIQSVDLTIS
jgi:hypothetical protein